jgi:hypothetical protein
MVSASEASGVVQNAMIRPDGCVDPLVITAVEALEVALSYEVIIGSIALRRTSHALTTLLPAALGLALGAGQGSMLAKALIPASRCVHAARRMRLSLCARIASSLVVTLVAHGMSHSVCHGISAADRHTRLDGMRLCAGYPHRLRRWS